MAWQILNNASPPPIAHMLVSMMRLHTHDSLARQLLVFCFATQTPITHLSWEQVHLAVVVFSRLYPLR